MTPTLRPLEVPRPGRAPLAAATLALDPPGATALLVLAHGAGAGPTHPFLEDLCRRLADLKVATLRVEFPYMHAGRKMPDRRPVLLATLRAALARGRELAGARPLVAGGKSMGGRMFSLLLADPEPPDPPPLGLLFLGFPLHPAGKPGTDRAAHLPVLNLPTLFVQGTRDRLAELDLLRPIVADLGPRATLHVVEGADHGFAARKRDQRSREELLDEIAGTCAAWIRSAPWSD